MVLFTQTHRPKDTVAMETLLLDHQLQENLFFRDQSFPIQHYIDNLKQWPDYQVPLHWHMGYEFFSTLSQDVEVQVGDKRFTLLQGESILIGGSQLHGYRLTTLDRPCLCPNIVFSEDILAPLSSTMYQNYFLPFLNNFSLPYVVFSPAVAWQRELCEYLFATYNLGLSEGNLYEVSSCLPQLRRVKSECFELDIHLNLLKIFRILFAHRSDLPYIKATHSDHTTQIRLQKMLQYIQGHYSESISLKTLAASAGISRSEAGRCFHRYCMPSPMSYINLYRLQQAQKLLLNSTLSIQQISDCCGFKDSSYFIKVFRNHTAQTPSAFRKTHVSIRNCKE